LTLLYFIRHGQAGSRDRYDSLSELGREQARLLGRYLASQEVRFSAAYSGTLVRQRGTAGLVAEACGGSGVSFPPIVEDTRWNEFDFDEVYRSLAPRIAAGDPGFKLEYDAMRLAAADPLNPVHRTWNRCDAAVVRAWIEERFECGCESWSEFAARVRAPLGDLTAAGPGAIAIFTSATPIAIWIALALELDPRTTLRLAGVSYNTCITTLRLDRGRLSLFTFNGTPHLPDSGARTFR
jgi:broad specificity phosphatase PhoE